MKLSGDDIVVVHRSDGSGTTYIWTDFLSKASPDWKTKVGTGTSPNWPVGLGGKGNEGVTGLIKQTPGSIGYVELIYAVSEQHSLRQCSECRRTICQSQPRECYGGSSWRRERYARQTFESPLPTHPGATSYPISSFTWLLVPDHFQDAAKAIRG